ncbi:MAG: hypothetical protein Q9213_005541 [Squamulea squamosa]
MGQPTVDIAIIGMACRVAGANSPLELWDNLLSSKDVQRRITRFKIDGFHHPEGASRKGLTNVDRAYMLDDDVVDKFDNAFFHVNPTEAAAMDPQQRLEGSDYHTVLARDVDATPKYIVTGTAGCMASNRLSYFYNLSGPSVTVDTACSSSMAAFHQAVRTLQHGDSNMALVCGANLIFNPESFVTMTELGFLSASGRCRSFDADADGYGRGEGVCCILLKPLEQAKSDGDPIWAVVKGTRLNQDGRTQGITLPSAKAQEENMHSLHKELQIDKESIQYLEAHGTGTAAGDPIELQAVKQVYKDHPLVIGSAKSNFGHCEAASALVGLIKTVLCLRHGKIPAQMHLKTLNPRIDLTGTNITIPRMALPWPEPLVAYNSRRAAINTFGAGGTNGYAVVEAYSGRPSEDLAGPRSWLFKISAADEVSLQSMIETYAAYVEQNKPSLRDLAHTLLAHRSSLRCSKFFVATNHDALLAQLRSNHDIAITKTCSQGKVLFVFTGQGVQWARMGCELLEQSKLFRFMILECDSILQDLPRGPSWSIVNELSKAKEHSNVDIAQYSQPLCTALQIGLISLLRSWGVKPTVVVGHSSGEIAAAYAAGMISLRSAIVTAYYRGLVLDDHLTERSNKTSEGSMCAVGMSEGECEALLKDCHDRVQIAAVNSPQSCTLSGDREAIQMIIELCKKRRRFCRQLKVNKAAPYEILLKEANILPDPDTYQCEIISSVTGQRLGLHELTPSYWVHNMTTTVQFASAAEVCLADDFGIDCVVEIGPHPALKSAIQELLRSSNKDRVQYLHTCRRDINDFGSMLECAGGLIAAGVPLDAKAINADGLWDGNEFYGDYGKSEHKSSLSTAIYILMATEAARQTLTPISEDRTAVTMTNVRCLQSILQPAPAGEQRKFETQFISKTEECSSRMSFEIFRTVNEVTDGWQLCSTGTLELSSELPKVSGHSSGNTSQDSLFWQRVHTLYPYSLDVIENLQISDGIIGGDISRLQHSWQTYSIHPVALASILSLGPMSVLGQNLPVKHCISSIPVLNIQIVPQNAGAFKFRIETGSTLANGAISKLEVTNGGRGILAGAVQYMATEIIPPRSITSSLFFRPLYLPDITKHVRAQDMDINYCIQLLTHKWPMSDVIIRDVSTDVRKTIMGTFTQGPKQRKKFRSIFVIGDVHESDASDSAQYVTDIDSNMQAHILFTNRNSTVDWLLQYLRPAGLVCNCDVREEMENNFYEHFDYLCEITDSSQRLGALWRKKIRPPSLISRHQRITFASGSFKLQGSLNIRLQPEIISAFMNENKNERFDAILIDDLEKSIITTWSGSDLIPWLQHLMKHAESLLWVTLDASSSPFVDIAGSLLRTLQAEQPSLKVSWLCLDHTQMQSEQQLVVNIESAFASMIYGENEVRLEANKAETRIIRYLHDQDLSAAIGVDLPHEVGSPLGDRDYLLTLAAPYEPVVLSYGSTKHGRGIFSSVEAQQRPLPINVDNSDYNLVDADDPNHDEFDGDGLNDDDSMNLESGKVRVSIAVSVIDGKDLAAYNGQPEVQEPTIHDKSKNPTMALGTLFAGKVLASTAPSAGLDSSVVGWTYGAHTGTIVVPGSNIICVGEEDLPYDLARFASLATAMAVLDGHIRVRKHDNLRFCVTGTMLDEALSLAYLLLYSGSDVNEKLPPFVIETSEHGEVLVNNVPVDVHSYLSTHPPSLTDLWRHVQEYNLFRCSRPQCFPFKSYKAAFKAAIVTKEPVILLHNDFTGMAHVPIYRRHAKLFSSRGAYVIIGGLGGLGRYTCSWLVDHGATSLYVISRSGISSPEAQEVYNNLNSKGGVRLEVIKADACDRASMSNILAVIRTREPIKGVINMAMILGDAPMATMTGDEWDRALKVKIESSWILHEETKDDKLEFFVLFSSIASVLGNRNQGSYNVGNTFLNALATYRRREGRTAVAIALGAMSMSSSLFSTFRLFYSYPAFLLYPHSDALTADIGVLSTYATPTTPLTLTRSGLTHLTTVHLDKILEAAFYKSRQQRAGNETVPEDAIIVTGLDMWEDETDGKGDGTVYWRGCPEFSHLAIYKPPASTADKQGKERSLKERTKDIPGTGEMLVKGKKELEKVIMEAFLSFLSRTLGFPPETFDTSNPLGTYGLDSLNAVGVQYWCWREVGVNVSVAEVFATKSIINLIGTVCKRLLSTNANKENGGDRQEDKGAENDAIVVDKVAEE